MKNLKKNNKGFSLVELIVVVLIMAIIAVALAPQVLRWVDHSRKSADLQLKDSIVSAVKVALTDKDVVKSMTADITITVNNTEGKLSATNNTLKEAVELNLEKKIDKLETKASSGIITITIAKADGNKLPYISAQSYKVNSVSVTDSDLK